MNKKTIFLWFSIVVLILGLFISPGIPLIYGLAILYILWSEAGGMSYGNPYKKKMLEEGRWEMSKSAHSPLSEKESTQKNLGYPPVLLLLGFGNIIYAAVLILIL